MNVTRMKGQGHWDTVLCSWARHIALTVSLSTQLYIYRYIYILLDVLLFSITEYFYELCRILASP